MSTRTVTKSKLLNIQKIWAENGIVKVTDHRDVTRNLDVRTALQRAKALNNMQLPTHLRAHQLELVEKIINVCREAKYQIEGGEGVNKKTELIQNVMNGKTAEGKDPNEVESEDTKIRRYAFMYPTLKDAEIATILRSPLDPSQQEYLMREKHAQRLKEIGPVAVVPK